MIAANTLWETSGPPCNREEPSAVKVLPRLTQEQQHLQGV